MTTAEQTAESGPQPEPDASNDHYRSLRRRPGRLLLAALVAALAAGTASQVTSGPADTGPARITATGIAPVGTVLIDGQGKALYQFAPDEASSVTCTGGCARKWPALPSPPPPAARPRSARTSCRT